MDTEAEVLCFSDDPSMADALKHAGADVVISPQDVLGHALGVRANKTVTSVMSTSASLSGNSILIECGVQADSPMDGTTLQENPLSHDECCSIVGLWSNGELELDPDDDAPITSESVLLVLTTRECLSDIYDWTTDPEHKSDVVIAGQGIVGSATASALETQHVKTTTVDIDPETGADIVGDVTTAAVLEEAGIAEAGGFVVAVGDDSAALLTIALARTLNPKLDIFARLTNSGTVDRALQAGADYTLSLPRISSRLVARVLQGEQIVALTQQTRVVREEASEYGDTTSDITDALEGTDKSLVVIEHDDTVIHPSELTDVPEGSTLILVSTEHPEEHN